LARQGRASEAHEVATETREQAPESSPLAQIHVAVAEAFAAAVVRDGSAARERLGAAVSIASQQGDQIDLAEVHLAFARLLIGLGDGEGAVEQLAAARDVLREIGAYARVVRIDAEIDRLRSTEATPAEEASA
jgi:ATP/maltotriose-dependent transcriptional regulator MalT